MFAFGYARASHDDILGRGAFLTATISANVCTYPSFFVPDGSPEPVDHPLGCDYTPTVSGDGGVGWDTRYRYTNGVYSVTQQAVGFPAGYGSLHGEDAYAGSTWRTTSSSPASRGARTPGACG